MPKLVKVEGRIFSVPDDATPDEIDAIANPAASPNQRVGMIASHAPTKAAPLATGHAPAQFTPEQLNEAANYRGRFDVPGLMNLYGDMGKGVLQGGTNTALGVSRLLNKIPVVGERLAPTNGIQNASEWATPKTFGQKVGYVGEQMGEMLLPSGLAGKVATKVGTIAPKLAKGAQLATEGLATGALNKAQGGDFTTGALVGAAAPAIAPVVKKAASGLAGIAVAPGKLLLKSIPEGMDIGETVLNNSTGVKPKVIVRQLTDKLAGVNSRYTHMLDDAATHGAEVDLAPVRQLAGNELNTAVAKNSQPYIKDVNNVIDQLTTQYGANGKPIGVLPTKVDPVKARALRQGVDMNIGTWNPQSQANIAPLQERVRGTISTGIHTAVPGSEALDSAMSSLIPAREAAWNTSFNPSVARNIFNRIARPTGALAGGIAGGYEGYKRDGVRGGLIGGTVGLALPEAITSPMMQMAGARAITKPVIGRFVAGAGLQLDRKKLRADEDNPGE